MALLLLAGCAASRPDPRPVEQGLGPAERVAALLVGRYAGRFRDNGLSDRDVVRLRADVGRADVDGVPVRIVQRTEAGDPRRFGLVLEPTRVATRLEGRFSPLGDNGEPVGTCPLSGDDLLVRRSRRGSYFVGCDGFPECRYTLPLPNKGEPAILDETCEEHGLNHVKMLAGRNTFVHGCPRCEALEAQMTQDELIGVCPECGEEHGGELAIKTLQSGSRLVGCTRYPECEYSLPLPRRGDVVVTDETCDEHGLPFLEIHDGEDDDDPWELGCPICNYEEYRARTEVRDIEDLDGVGAKTAKALKKAGITTAKDLAAAKPAKLEKIDGIGKATAAHLACRGATVAIVGSTVAKGKRAARMMSGRFFGPEGDEIDVPDDLQDPALRERLWRVSEELSGLAEAPAAPTP